MPQMTRVSGAYRSIADPASSGGTSTQRSQAATSTASCCWLTRTGPVPRRLLPGPAREVGKRGQILLATTAVT